MLLKCKEIYCALLLSAAIISCKDKTPPVDESSFYKLTLSKSTIYEKRTSDEIKIYTPYELTTELIDYQLKARGHCWSSTSSAPTLADRSAEATNRNPATALPKIAADSTYYIEPYFVFNNGKILYGRDLKQKTLIFRRKTCEVATVKPTLKEIPFPTQLNYLNWTIAYWVNNSILHAFNIVGDCWAYDRSARTWNPVAKLPFETKKEGWQHLIDFDCFSSNHQSYAILTKISDQSGSSSITADSVQLWKLNAQKKEWIKLAILHQPAERSTFLYEKSGKLYFLRTYYSNYTGFYKIDEYDIEANQWKNDVIPITFPIFIGRQGIGNALYLVRNGVYASGRGAIVERNIDTGTERNLDIDIVCSIPIVHNSGYCLAMGEKLWVGGGYWENTDANSPYKHVFIHGVTRWFTPKTNQWSTVTYDIGDLLNVTPFTFDYPQAFSIEKHILFIHRSQQKMWEWEIP